MGAPGSPVKHPDHISVRHQVRRRRKFHQRGVDVRKTLSVSDRPQMLAALRSRCNPSLAIYYNIRTMSTRHILNPNGTSDSIQAQQYTKGSLDLDQLSSDPVSQFDIWFKHAQSERVHQPETVTLSTAELPSGRVSARMVYLKEFDDEGFVIYSNWGTSRKAHDISTNPNAALTFWWHELERQVRVEGPCERMTSEESQIYYDTRIKGSRIGAWASQQSKVLKDRAELELQVADVEKRFDGQEKIPVPDFWGGLRVKPETVEFWQGRPSRLHDRFQYTRDEKGKWKVERLSP